ncbi:hypothetical protein BLL42_19510 [Pseudomonas frederiksbergensis]|uniref:Uncharacterized protein n=1 Tax=Pseudomonas frederiksbergensis TaxID=104087 RepID=A0A1J0EPQ8_9PSED|nr:hypothetical protein BLL42_19510 [Pseudomonas frederiksbergensis]
MNICVWLMVDGCGAAARKRLFSGALQEVLVRVVVGLEITLQVLQVAWLRVPGLLQIIFTAPIIH